MGQRGEERRLSGMGRIVFRGAFKLVVFQATILQHHILCWKLYGNLTYDHDPFGKRYLASFCFLIFLYMYILTIRYLTNIGTFVFFIKMKALTWHGMWCRVNLIWPLFIKYTKKIINDKMSLGLILYHTNRGGMDSNKILLQLIINLFFHYLTWRHWPSLWCGRPNPDVLTYMPPVFMTHSPSPPIWHGFMKSPYVLRRSDCFYAMGIHVLYII